MRPRAAINEKNADANLRFTQGSPKGQFQQIKPPEPETVGVLAENPIKTPKNTLFILFNGILAPPPAFSRMKAAA